MTAVENAGRSSFMLLQVGKRRFALPAGIVVELAPPVRLHTFPHTSPLISGVIVRRGRIVPVFDAGAVLIGRNSATHRFYLVARRDFGKAGELGAIPVDGECELATGEVQPPLAESPQYVSGKLAIGEESLDVLDFEAMVTSHSAAADESGRAEAQP